MSRFALLVLLALAAFAPAQDKKKDAKPPGPKVLYTIPLVVKPGEKQKLAVRGKNLDAVKEVTVAGTEAKVKVLGAKKVAVPNNYPAEKVGDSEAEIELELPKDAKPGAVTLTAAGPAGESAPHALLVADNTPAVKEKEPNDGFDQAQPIPVPCAVDGTIKAERDVDVYKLDGKKGDTLRIEVQAAKYGSPTDPLVSLYDANRQLTRTARPARPRSSSRPSSTATPSSGRSPAASSTTARGCRPSRGRTCTATTAPAASGR
jgi:hypothetical protein